MENSDRNMYLISESDILFMFNSSEDAIKEKLKELFQNIIEKGISKQKYFSYIELNKRNKGYYGKKRKTHYRNEIRKFKNKI